MDRRTVTKVFAAVSLWLGLPALAAAQSAISGLVRDTSGGVLPGVTVEAASPALIEKVRTVATDEQGRYSIVDLRPGVYKLTFGLQGFGGLVRDGIELPAGFTATINAELTVGSIEETVTVTSESPVVNVQSAQRTATLKRELLDAVPMARTYAPEALLAVGVKVDSQNVGGARAANQQRVTVHGTTSLDTTIEVDGMKMNTGNNDTQPNHNDAMTQEVVVQTSAPGAEVSSGGLRLNLIPREGGNRYSGFSFFTFADGSWQKDNLTDELKAKGLTTPEALDYLWDFTPTLGGPIVQDRLWFLASYRDSGNGTIIPNSFYPDGSPGIADQTTRNITLRLTLQANSKNKVSVYHDRAFKHVLHTFTQGTDVATASSERPPRVFYTGAVKWTSTVSEKLLLESGWGIVLNNVGSNAMPGVVEPRGSAAWYAKAPKQDIVLGTLIGGPAGSGSAVTNPIYQLVSSATYVTGSHAFKTGVQWRFGSYGNSYDNANADLTQRYRSGIPDSVTVRNTPVRFREEISADLGIFAQDSSRYKRVTVNPGIRFELFNAGIAAVEAPPGRFAPFRSFPAVANIPSFSTVAPRFGLAYDLTGDAKTAIKVSLNKYFRADWAGYTTPYDPARLQSDTRNWTDLNRDDIAQDNEIGAANVDFNAPLARHPDPDLKRPYNIEFSLGVDRELFPGTSIGAAWFRRGFYDIQKADNLLVTPADYASFVTPSPLNGEPITIYNLNRAKQGQVDILDTTATDRDLNRQSYDAIEVSFSARLPGGGNLFGGWSTDRTMTVTCDGDDPNTYRYCDQTALDMPFRHDFKVAGSYPLPFGMQVGATMQDFAGGQLLVNWAVPANVFPGGQRTQAVTVSLVPPGSKFLERWNELDMNVKKIFRRGRTTLDVSLDIFNALNSSVVLSENQAYGPSLGMPISILQGRLFRISSLIKF